MIVEKGKHNYIKNLGIYESNRILIDNNSISTKRVSTCINTSIITLIIITIIIYDSSFLCTIPSTGHSYQVTKFTNFSSCKELTMRAYRNLMYSPANNTLVLPFICFQEIHQGHYFFSYHIDQCITLKR